MLQKLLKLLATSYVKHQLNKASDEIRKAARGNVDLSTLKGDEKIAKMIDDLQKQHEKSECMLKKYCEKNPNSPLCRHSGKLPTID